MRFQNLDIPLSQVTKEPHAPYLKNLTLDSREVQPGDFFLCLKGESHDSHDYVEQAIESGAGGIIFSRNDLVLPNHVYTIHVEDTLEFLHQLSAYRARTLPAIRIAITGSNGKTSTKELLTFLLRGLAPDPGKVHATQKNYNNFFGVPYTILSAPANCAFLVVEAGTNHPGEIETLSRIIQPHIALITSISQGHIGNFRDLQAISKEKFSISAGLVKDGKLIIPESLFALAQKMPLVPELLIAKAETLGIQSYYQKGGNFFVITDSGEFSLPITGEHQYSNLVLALTAIKETNLAFRLEGALKIMSKFNPPEGRLRPFEHNNLVLWDDTYNANPASFKAAIEMLAKNRGQNESLAAVVGEMLELGDQSPVLHEQTGELMAKNNFSPVLFQGSEVSKAAFEKGYLRHTSSKNALLTCNPDPSDAERKALISQWFELLKKPAQVLLKGSRGMRMEKWLDPIKELNQ